MCSNTRPVCFCRSWNLGAPRREDARKIGESWTGGHWAKPVDALNREPEKVVVVDKEGDEKWQPHPNNCIAIPKWDGNDDDDENDTAVRLPASLLCTNGMSDELIAGSCWT